MKKESTTTDVAVVVAEKVRGMQEMLATAGEPPARAAQLLRQYIGNMVKTASKSLRCFKTESTV